MKHRINPEIARINRQQGYTLIEIVIGLAIAALVLGAAAYYGKKVFDDQRVSDEIQRFNLGSSKLKSFYSTSADTKSIDDAKVTTEQLVKIGAITDENENDTKNSFKSKIGGTFGIVSGQVSVANDGFVWTYTGVPEANCVNFTKSIAPNVPKITLGANDAVVVKNITGSNGRVYDETSVLTGCSGDNNITAITFQKN